MLFNIFKLIQTLPFCGIFIDQYCSQFKPSFLNTFWRVWLKTEGVFLHLEVLVTFLCLVHPFPQNRLKYKHQLVIVKNWNGIIVQMSTCSFQDKKDTNNCKNCQLSRFISLACLECTNLHASCCIILIHKNRNTHILNI